MRKSMSSMTKTPCIFSIFNYAFSLVSTCYVIFIICCHTATQVVKMKSKMKKGVNINYINTFYNRP